MKYQSGISCVPAPRQKAGHGLPNLLLIVALSLGLGVTQTAWSADSTNVQWPDIEIKRDPNALRPNQTRSTGVPPQSPSEFSPDPGVPPLRTNAPPEPAMTPRLIRTTNNTPPLPPAVFNPDPGAVNSTNVYRPFYTNEIRMPPDYSGQPIPPDLSLPRTNIVGKDLKFSAPTHAPPYGSDPLDPEARACRAKDARHNLPVPYKWDYSDYPLAAWGESAIRPTHSAGDEPAGGWGSLRGSVTPAAPRRLYASPVTMLWHPYKQSLLKGDAPVIGQDIFLDLTASSETVFEARRVPTPSGISASQPDSTPEFLRPKRGALQWSITSRSRSICSKAIPPFSPSTGPFTSSPSITSTISRLTRLVSWGLTRAARDSAVIPAPPNNGGIINPGEVPGFLEQRLPRRMALPASYDGKAATTRTRQFMSLQEAFAESHLGTTFPTTTISSPRVSATRPFSTTIFAAFYFNDVNTGARLFGNIENNHYQYNFALFDLREKDTDSGLNTLDSRRQRVIAANLYRQDFLWHGYTAQLSFLANLDDGGTHYDENGNLVRPAPIGTLQAHSFQAY